MIDEILENESGDQVSRRHQSIKGGIIRKLWPTDVDLYREHLLRLDPKSRRQRFACSVSDDFIGDYAGRMNDYGNVIYGYIVGGSLRAVAEIKKLGDGWGSEAEAAFSVEAEWQNTGIGTELMGRVIRTARNRGIHLLFMSCMAENTKMMSIARHYEADLRFEYGDVVGEIVPHQADYFSYMAEAMEDRTGYMLAVLDLQARMLRKAS